MGKFREAATRHTLLDDFNNGLLSVKDSDPTKVVEYMRDVAKGALEKNGFDFESKEDIDDLKEFIDNYRGDCQKDKEKLEAEYKKILIQSGATEQELQWGNLHNAKPNFLQQRKLKKLWDKIDILENSLLCPVFFELAAGIRQMPGE